MASAPPRPDAAGARPPDANDPCYRARLADECRELARLTPDESDMAIAFALAEQTKGWRPSRTATEGTAPTPATIRRGAVVLLHLPGDKPRSAVVVRSDLLSELSYATVLPITTDRGYRAATSMRIDLAPTVENGLQAASQAMLDWPMTIRFSSIRSVIGRLDTKTMRIITRQLPIVFGTESGSDPPRRR